MCASYHFFSIIVGSEESNHYFRPCESKADAMEYGKKYLTDKLAKALRCSTEDGRIAVELEKFGNEQFWEGEYGERMMLLVKESCCDEEITDISYDYYDFIENNDDMKPSYAVCKVHTEDGRNITEIFSLADGEGETEKRDCFFACSDIFHLLRLCLPDNTECGFRIIKVLSFGLSYEELAAKKTNCKKRNTNQSKKEMSTIMEEKKYKLIYASEENGFETEVTDYDVAENVVEAACELSDEIGLYEEEGAMAVEEGYYESEGLDAEGYHVYILACEDGEESERGIRHIEELREEMREEIECE